MRNDAYQRTWNWLAPIAGLELKVDSERADIDAVLTWHPPIAGEPEEMPLPSAPKIIFLGGLFVLALLATAYVASEIVLPLISRTLHRMPTNARR